MKKIIALLLALMLAMVVTLGCKQKAPEAPATHEEMAPSEETAPAEQPAAEQPMEEHEAPAEAGH